MSLFATLRAGPPPPKVALLPDGLFFTRSLPVGAGATGPEAAAQVELALEGISPFPIAQLYYGYYWVPGSESALVFAAYRRRFTTEQIEAWAGAELVLPAFATLLGAEVAPATTVLLASAEGLTGIHWSAGQVPTSVITRSWPPAVEGTPEAEPAIIEEAQARLRDELIREIGGSHTVIDLSAPPQAQPIGNDREVKFRAEQLVAHFPPNVVSPLDVRDKGQLAALRAARNRDVLLWRVAMGCVAALVLLGVAELALIGGRAWQKKREDLFKKQKPFVEQIMSADALARRIDDLANKRLLPWEMIVAITGEKRERLPAEVYFNRVSTVPGKGIYVLAIEGQTTNISTWVAYKAMLKSLPGIAEVESTEQARGDTANFTLTVTFKPDAIKAGAGL